MFISKKEYNEMIQRYKTLEDKYISKCAMLTSSVNCLREGIIHAMIYLDYSDDPNVDIGRTRLRTAYICTLDKRDNNIKSAIEMMPDKWKDYLRQYEEYIDGFTRA